MVELKHPLLTTRSTKVLYEENYNNNAPHDFMVVKSDGSEEVLGMIHFQDGAIKEAGVNGVMNEDLIGMVLCRLECFQNSPFACKENEMAQEKLCEALMWLRKRTTEREMRGVMGTYRK